ncbi:D-alanyl-D-alanine carboxypeptidase/D-alanyl-D-alanine-endopeptidase [Qipengyuania sp.]|uniref:D-alanyl-D-alanine carboxypeptidase/D-alanyl-D-alanine endopeptidase n=1 Tax=Qipengyuania sp. TaxID=2004515 RepID=UPI0035C78EC5
MMRNLSLIAAVAWLATVPSFAQSPVVRLPAPSAPTAPSLPAEAGDPLLLEQVQAILSSAPAGTRYGMMVETIDGRPLLAIAPDQRFMPASNTKIFTTVATYARLPELQERARGTGVRLEKNGDVVIEGRGDPNLSSAPDCVADCLATLADAIAARTRHVRDVIGDDRFYPDDRWSPGMSWNNIPFTWGTGISALSVDDNEFTLTVEPAEVGKPPRLSGNGYFSLRNDALTIAGDKSDLGLWRMPGSRELRVFGTVGVNTEADKITLGIDDPAHYAAFRLKQMLAERGVKVTGEVEARHRPLSPLDDPETRGDAPAPATAELPFLAQLPPPALAKDVHRTNKVSQNLHAELLMRRLGRLSGGGSIADGEAVLTAVLTDAGVPEGAHYFADGSGMSTYNRVTPRATVTLLRWVAGQPWGAEWRESLPIGGKDGTLGRRFKGTALEGTITAKTGSINASRALSGYMPGASGQMLVLSVFANDIPPGGEAAAVAAMDTALLAIAAAN